MEEDLIDVAKPTDPPPHGCGVDHPWTRGADQVGPQEQSDDTDAGDADHPQGDAPSEDRQEPGRAYTGSSHPRFHITRCQFPETQNLLVSQCADSPMLSPSCRCASHYPPRETGHQRRESLILCLRRAEGLNARKCRVDHTTEEEASLEPPREQ